MYICTYVCMHVIKLVHTAGIVSYWHILKPTTSIEYAFHVSLVCQNYGIQKWSASLWKYRLVIEDDHAIWVVMIPDKSVGGTSIKIIQKMQKRGLATSEVLIEFSDVRKHPCRKQPVVFVGKLDWLWICPLARNDSLKLSSLKLSPRHPTWHPSHGIQVSSKSWLNAKSAARGLSAGFIWPASEILGTPSDRQFKLFEGQFCS